MSTFDRRKQFSLSAQNLSMVIILTFFTNCLFAKEPQNQERTQAHKAAKKTSLPIQKGKPNPDSKTTASLPEKKSAPPPIENKKLEIVKEWGSKALSEGKKLGLIAGAVGAAWGEKALEKSKIYGGRAIEEGKRLSNLALDSMNENSHQFLDAIKLEISVPEFTKGTLQAPKIWGTDKEFPAYFPSSGTTTTLDIAVCSNRKVGNLCSEEESIILGDPRYSLDKVTLSGSKFKGLGLHMDPRDFIVRFQIKATSNYFGQRKVQMEKSIPLLEILRGLYNENKESRLVLAHEDWNSVVSIKSIGEAILPFTLNDLMKRKVLSIQWQDIRRGDFKTPLENVFKQEGQFQFRVSICQRKFQVLKDCISKDSKILKVPEGSRSNDKVDNDLLSELEPVTFEDSDILKLVEQKSLIDSFLVIEIKNLHWSGITINVGKYETDFLPIAMGLLAQLGGAAPVVVNMAGSDNFGSNFKLFLANPTISISPPQNPSPSDGTNSQSPSSPPKAQSEPTDYDTDYNDKSASVPTLNLNNLHELNCETKSDELQRSKCLAINAYIYAYLHPEKIKDLIPEMDEFKMKELFKMILTKHQEIPIDLPPDSSHDWHDCGSNTMAYTLSSVYMYGNEARNASAKIYFCHLGWDQEYAYQNVKDEIDLEHFRAQTLIHELSHAGYHKLLLRQFGSDECHTTLVETSLFRIRFGVPTENGYVSNCKNLPAILFEPIAN